MDINLGKENGIEMISEILNAYPEVKIIMITAYNDAKRAVASLKAGAFDYITKPYEIEEVDISLKRALKLSSLEKEVEVLHAVKGERIPEIIGESPAVAELKRLLSKTFNNDVPVLITGESGTGKELCAKAVHNNSDRKNNPFVPSNISALPDNLVEAELFGYEKGAFTGAVKARRGYFELANGGTLFLDEIGEISSNIQVKLLRVLETGEVPVLGSEKHKKVDVRIICATNRNLKESVKSGAFREDLYYRISVFHIVVPPLRERGNDLKLLADYFLDNYKYSQSADKKKLSPASLQRLYSHKWKGNVRELFHVLERALLVSESSVITPECLPEADADDITFDSGKDLLSRVSNFEKNIIEDSLKKNGNNQAKTAKSLGLSRTSLIYKLKKYGFMTDGE
jgi:DNA-binding NtrC family response regulator